MILLSKHRVYNTIIWTKELYIDLYYPICIQTMVLSDPVDRLMRAALISDQEFVRALNHIHEDRDADQCPGNL